MALGHPLAAQANVEHSLRHQGLTRLYTVHLPPGFSAAGPQRPVVIVLHGGTGTRANVQGFTRMNFTSNANGFLAVYPEGAGPAGAGFSWADGRGVSADDLGIDDVGFVDRLIDSLRRDYPIDTNRLYLCGFSNGGFMVQRIACERNRRFAAMASLGSTLDSLRYASCAPGRPIPFMFVMGTADPSVPYAGGPMPNGVLPVIGMTTLVDFWATNNGCQTTLPPVDLPDIDLTDNSTVTRFERGSCAQGARVLFYRVNGGGHTWPGVEIPSLEPTAGETNEDIQASDELWAFFSQHSRSPVTSLEAELPLPSVAVYPNPFRTQLEVRAERAVHRVTLYDLRGCVVLSVEPRTEQASLDVRTLAPGPYSLRLDYADGRSQHLRLLRE